MWDKRTIKREDEILGALNAIAIFKRERNLYTIQNLFPKYIPFIKEIQHSDLRQVEKELMDELNQLQLVYS